MDYFEINGSKTLNGVVEVSGAKNAVLPLMAAAILNKDKLSISNVPNLSDSITMSKLLEEMGAEIISSGFERIPHDTKELNEEQQAEVEKLLAKFDEDDDVQLHSHA